MFSHALDQSTFTSADIKLVDASGIVIDTNNWTIGTPTTSDGISWTIEVTPPTGAHAIDVTAVRLKIDAGSITDIYGNINAELIQASSSQSFDTIPEAAASNPILGDDLDGGGYGNADTITLRFNEPIDTTKITLAVLNAALSNSHTFGTATNSASVSASDASGGYATTFVITLGSDATVNVNDTITLPKANVVDANSNQASVDIVFTVPIPSSGPTAALTEPVSVSDVDTSGGYSANDTITVKFSTDVVIANLTIDKFVVSGKTLGTSASVVAVGGDGTNASTFTITLGTSPSVVASDQISIDKASVVDTSGRAASGDVTFALADITPPTIASVNAIVASDEDNSGGFNVGDTLTVSFDEAVNIANLTTDVANVFSVNNTHTLGTGFSVVAVGGADGFSTQFRITLGSSPSVVATDTLSVVKDKVEDSSGNKPTADLTFSVPSVVVPATDTTTPITQSDADTSGSYTAEDTITLKFNKAVNSSLVLGDFSVAGKGFGTGATLTAGTESPAGYATEFTITLKAGTTVAQGDQISVDGTKVVDEKGNSASGNVVFTLVDITPPSASGNAVPGDVGSGNVGSYGVGDTLTINFSEGIKVSEITDSDLIDGSITLTGTGSTFGTGATIVAANAAAGLATQFTITLGSGTDVASGDTITVNADQIKDNANNSPTVAQTFSVPAVSVPTISSISVPSGNYGSGDKITVTVNFSENVTVNLNGGTMTLKLDVGGSEVLAEYKGGSGTSALTFNYYASGVIDSDGITVVANSINKNTATIKNAGNEDAELTHAQQTFASATVDAPFDLSKVASIWLDSTDIDGDGDTTDQSENDVVTRVVDKSGNGNDVTGSGGSAPVLKNLGMNNGNLSIYFDGNDNLTSGANNPNLGTAGYTYFVSASTPNRNTTDYNYLFGTRSEADGVAMFLKTNGTTYHLNSVTTNSYNGVDVGTGVTTKSFVLSDLANPGASRTFSQDGTETSLTTLTNLVAGQQINLGSTGTGGHRLRGYINEALYFKRVLSDAEMCIVENYLSSKWRPFKFQVQLFTPKKEQDAVGIIYSFLGLVKRSTNEPIQTSYSRAKIPYLSMFKTGNDAVIHC